MVPASHTGRTTALPLPSPGETPHKTTAPPSSSKAGRQQRATVTSSTLPRCWASPGGRGGKRHSRCPIGLPEALVGLRVGKAVHATRWASLWRDVRGAVVVVVLTAEAPGGHGPCGGSCISGAQLDIPLPRLLGVSHRAERPARTAAARSPSRAFIQQCAPAQAITGLACPKVKGAWHIPTGSSCRLVPLFRAHPDRTGSGSCKAEPGCDPLHVRQGICVPLL